jgi:hypothetical protein
MTQKKSLEDIFKEMSDGEETGMLTKLINAPAVIRIANLFLLQAIKDNATAIEFRGNPLDEGAENVYAEKCEPYLMLPDGSERYMTPPPLHLVPATLARLWHYSLSGVFRIGDRPYVVEAHALTDGYRFDLKQKESEDT